MIRLLLADDHRMFLEGLEALINSIPQTEVVGTATNGEEVLRLLEKVEVDVVVLDYNMPKMDGLACTRAIRKRYPDLKVVIVSMYHSSYHIQRILKAGAQAYILKNTGKAELEEALRAVTNGQSYFGKQVTEQIMLSLQNKQRHERDYTIVDLSPREKEVLILISKERTSLEIADELCISKHTVETYRKNLISKLNVRNVTGLVRYAIEHGLLD